MMHIAAVLRWSTSSGSFHVDTETGAPSASPDSINEVKALGIVNDIAGVAGDQNLTKSLNYMLSLLDLIFCPIEVKLSPEYLDRMGTLIVALAVVVVRIQHVAVCVAAGP
jgi:hypothetical protein